MIIKLIPQSNFKPKLEMAPTYKLNPFSFKGINEKCENIVHEKVADKLICQTTSFYRNDVNWSEFVSFIERKFPSNVKIYNSACSQAAEIYTLLLEAFSKSKNFFKGLSIEARDIGPIVIKKDQAGIIDLTSKDINKLKGYIPKYFEKIPNSSSSKGIYRFQVSPELRKKVNFQVEDIMDFSKSINDYDVIMFRNSWYHLSHEDQKILTQNLFKNMKPNSILVIGEHEYPESMKLIENAGFKKIKNYKSLNPDIEEANDDYNLFSLKDKVCLVYEKPVL